MVHQLIYSYGIILWEIWTRKVPWGDIPGNSFDEFRLNLETAVCSGVRPPIPSSGRKKLPRRVAELEDVDAEVQVDRYGQGVLRYFGAYPHRFYGRHDHQDGKTMMCGVELVEPNGKHDGEIDGHRYFQSKRSHGVMVDPESVLVIRDASHEPEAAAGPAADDGAAEEGSIAKPPVGYQLLMERCWTGEPSERPRFDAVLDRLLFT